MFSSGGWGYWGFFGMGWGRFCFLGFFQLQRELRCTEGSRPRCSLDIQQRKHQNLILSQTLFFYTVLWVTGERTEMFTFPFLMQTM